jgi:hypothetical protein
MFNKNHKDPLVDAVQAAMQKGAQDRAAIAKVNETFGIQAKRQLPHERHAEYDKAIATALNGGGPKALVEETVAEEQIDELSDPKLFNYLARNKKDRKANSKGIKGLIRKHTASGKRKAANREAGLERAVDRLYSKKMAVKSEKRYNVNEESIDETIEQLDELSRKTLKSYLAKNNRKQRRADDKKNFEGPDALEVGSKERTLAAKKSSKREAGSQKAYQRLRGTMTVRPQTKKYGLKEEQIDEIKEYGVDGERARANPKAEKLKAILKRRLGKGDGTESVSQSRREDK